MVSLKVAVNCAGLTTEIIAGGKDPSEESTNIEAKKALTLAYSFKSQGRIVLFDLAVRV